MRLRPDDNRKGNRAGFGSHEPGPAIHFRTEKRIPLILKML
jgi:hypothetical protein